MYKSISDEVNEGISGKGIRDEGTRVLVTRVLVTRVLVTRVLVTRVFYREYEDIRAGVRGYQIRGTSRGARVLDLGVTWQ